MKKVICLLFLAVFLIVSLPVFADNDSAELYENFNTKDIVQGYSGGEEKLIEPYTSASTPEKSGWIYYYRSSKGTTYGHIMTVNDNDVLANKYLRINRNVTSSTDATVYFGYYNATGFDGENYTVDMKILIEPGSKTHTGGYYKKYITLADTFTAEDVITITFTNKEDPENPEERIDIVTYKDMDSNEIEIEGLNPNYNEWYNVRFTLDQVNKKYNFYFSKDPITDQTVPILSDVSYKDVLIKCIKWNVYRYANDPDGLKGGGAIALDDFKITKDVSDNIWYFGKSEAGSETFDSYEPVDNIYGGAVPGLVWTSYTGTDGTKYGRASLELEDNNINNKLLRIGNKSSYTSDIYVYYHNNDGLGAVNGKTVAQLRFKTDNYDPQSYLHYIVLGPAQVLSAPSAQVIIKDGELYIPDINGTRFLRSDGVETPIARATKLASDSVTIPIIEDERWYYVKFVIDLNNKTYDLYISDKVITEDTQPLKTDIPMYTEGDNPDTVSLTRFAYHLYTDNHQNYKIGAAYIDDVIINPVASDKWYGSITFTGDNNDEALAGNTTITVDVNLDIVDYNTSKDIDFDSMEYKIIVALYDTNGKIVDADLSKAAYLDTKKLRKTVKLPEDTDLTGYKLKAFLWNAIDGMMPLGESGSLN